MRRLWLVGLLLVPASAWADSIGINVGHTEDLIDLTMRINYRFTNPDNTTTKTATTQGLFIEQAAALSEAIEGENPQNYTRASADLFSVFVATGAGRDSSLHEEGARTYAIAQNEFQFNVDQDSSTALTLLFATARQDTFTGGFVQLFDITGQELLWRYQWGGTRGTPGAVESFGDANIPWTNSPEPGITHSALITFDQAFLAFHDYMLTIHTESGASFDSQSSRIDIYGLRAVPEPSTLVLFGLGIAPAFCRFRSRRTGFRRQHQLTH